MQSSIVLEKVMGNGKADLLNGTHFYFEITVTGQKQ